MRFACLAVLLLAATTAAAEPVETTVPGRVAVVGEGDAAPFALPQRELVPTRDAPDGIAVEGLAEPWFARMTIAGAPVTIVLGRSGEAAAHADVIAVDADADGRIAPEERHAVTPWERSERGVTVAGGSVHDLPIRVGSRVYPVDVGYRCAKGAEPRVGVLGRWYYELTLELEEKPFRICVRDGDLDGAFDATRDHWCVVGEKPPAAPEHVLALSADEGRYLDGHRFLLLGVKLTPEVLAARIAHEPADGPSEADLRRARERVEAHWKERLAPRAKSLAAQYLVDTARPRTETPIRWRYVTFEEGMAEAKRTGRPLLVEFRAFWCTPSYVMDLFTFPDREVADLIRNRFVAVRIVQEQDLGGDFRRLASDLGRGRMPVMGVWSSDGRIVHRVHGWRKPRDMLFELRTALERVGER